MKYIASVSLGKDSLAMILLLLEKQYPLDEVIWYDTGVEFEAINTNAEKLKQLLSEYKISFTVLKPKEQFIYSMLEKHVQKRNGKIQNGYKWCGGLCRWGTTNKIQAIEEYYKKYQCETIIEYIGIAADETERIEKERKKRKSKNIKLYPLAEQGMTEKQCLEFCYKNGWNWVQNGVDLYSILDRVSCWCCRNKNLKELKNIYYLLPEYWEKLKVLQEQIDIPFKANASIFDLEKRFIKEGFQKSLFN